MSSSREEEQRLPTRAFPLGNLALEQTKFFWSLKDRQYPWILAGFRDPGPANAQLPILAKLKESANICVVCDSKGQENLEAGQLGFFQDSNNVNKLLSVSFLVDNANVIFTSKSADSGIELALMANAKWNHLQETALRPQIVELEDYPGCIARWHYDNFNAPRWIRPDYIYAVSEWGKKKELESLPKDFNPERIIVTGHPNDDRLASENIEEIQANVRKKLQLGSRPIVIHMGTLPSSDTVNTLHPLVDILQKPSFEEAAFIFRPHPRDVESIAEYEAIYHPIKNRTTLGTNDMMVPILGLSKDKITDALGMSATVLINHGSTTGVDAVYRGIPTINTFIYNPPQSHDEVLQGYPLPVVEDGASPLVTTPEELSNILDSLLHDAEYQDKLRTNMARWKVDGHATERVAQLVLNLAREHQANRLIGKL
ncbi:MAG: hypothetical protein WCV81_05710 [Microgenomates group bacterium]|jgi:hypothetical protein